MRDGQKRSVTLISGLLLGTLITAVIVYAVQHPPLPHDEDRLAQEDSIREVVFRYQFDHNASGLKKDAAAYCLSLSDGRTDPSDQFITRFKGNQPPVRKISECGLVNHVVTDVTTGKRGLIFRVTQMRWISGKEVEVVGGYYEGGLSASGDTYRVVRQHGNWYVSEDRMNWIS